MKRCRLGKQVGFGCDFTTASDVTQVSSAFFFWCGNAAFEPGCCTCGWMGVPGFSGQPKIPVGFGLPTRKVGMVPLQQKGWDHHALLPSPPSSLGLSCWLDTPKSTHNPKPAAEALPVQGMVMISSITVAPWYN